MLGPSIVNGGDHAVCPYRTIWLKMKNVKKVFLEHVLLFNEYCFDGFIETTGNHIYKINSR
jgi:hypothetical protein